MGNIKQLLTEIEAARPDYEKAKRYSDGTVSEVWATEKLQKLFGKSADKFSVNIARRPIDAVLDRLEIMEVSVADDTALTDVLVTDVWKSNSLSLELPDALDLAETYGDAYLISWPRPGSDGTEADLFINDPVGMRIIYDPENPRRKLFAGRTWINSDGFRRVTLWFDGPRVERWVSTQRTKEADSMEDADFQPFLADEADQNSWFEDLDMGLDNPVHHLRTARPYGKPEHLQAYGTQNMLTKEIATMMGATDGYGYPFRAALTKAGTTGPTATLDDGDWGPDDPVRPPLAPKAPNAEPGTVARMHDVDSLVQLPPADVGNFLDPIGMTLRLSATVTNTPLSYFDPSAANASGESKKEHEKPAVKKADRRQMSFDATIKEALAYNMALLGHEDTVVMITWAPTASVDDAAEVELGIKRRDAGVPFLTFMTQMGYPKEEVERWMQEATPDDELLERRVKLLDTLAAAAQKLGAASALGTVEPAVAQQLIATFLTSTPAAVPPTNNGA